MRSWILALALTLPLTSAQETPSAPSGIYKSVVRIEVASQVPDYTTPWNSGRFSGGIGSGFIIGKNKILTNAHVVSSPLPYVVKVDVQDAAGDDGTAPADKSPAGKTRAVTFKHVEVVGYHPRLDLALVRIDPKELKEAKASLRPVTVAKEKGEPGQRVYVIGDPAGGNVHRATSASRPATFTQPRRCRPGPPTARGPGSRPATAAIPARARPG